MAVIFAIGAWRAAPWPARRQSHKLRLANLCLQAYVCNYGKPR
jgi:hypothetical protein